ncbi:phosphopantetheine-binding protein, partial [Streptomyces sp. NPDC050504]|uniref:phosphopantetheine-binding protein n=1 Tax=Streptomyces sp. NPDC050504 TaxID=3365618 RepID=UPI003787A5DF
RHTQGLPATSLAWGLWQQTSTITTTLTNEHHQGMESSGITALPTDEALALFDAALASGRPHLAPIGLDLRALRAAAGFGVLPPPLRGLVERSAPRRRGRAEPSLPQRLSVLAEKDQAALLLELVRTHTAMVLGHPSGDSIAAQRAFQEMGFDSLAAVKLRNQLNNATGLKLPMTVIFDHPNAAALADRLHAELRTDGSAPSAALTELEQFEATVLSLAPDSDLRPGVAARLRALLWKLDGDPHNAPRQVPQDDLDSASDDELFDVLENELGIARTHE